MNSTAKQVKHLLHPCEIHRMATEPMHVRTVCRDCGINYKDLPVGTRYKMVYNSTSREYVSGIHTKP